PTRSRSRTSADDAPPTSPPFPQGSPGCASPTPATSGTARASKIAATIRPPNTSTAPPAAAGTGPYRPLHPPPDEPEADGRATGGRTGHRRRGGPQPVNASTSVHTARPAMQRPPMRCRTFSGTLVAMNRPARRARADTDISAAAEPTAVGSQPSVAARLAVV